MLTVWENQLLSFTRNELYSQDIQLSNFRGLSSKSILHSFSYIGLYVTAASLFLYFIFFFHFLELSFLSSLFHSSSKLSQSLFFKSLAFSNSLFLQDIFLSTQSFIADHFVNHHDLLFFLFVMVYTCFTKLLRAENFVFRILCFVKCHGLLRLLVTLNLNVTQLKLHLPCFMYKLYMHTRKDSSYTSYLICHMYHYF